MLWLTWKGYGSFDRFDSRLDVVIYLMHLCLRLCLWIIRCMIHILISTKVPEGQDFSQRASITLHDW